MRPWPLIALLLACSPKDDPSQTTAPTAGTTTPGTTTSPATVAGLDDYRAWVDALDDRASCHGGYLPSELAAFEDLLARAEALATDADATDEEREALESELADALANPPAPIDHRADLAALLDGVTAVTAPGGTPSQIGVVGCNGLAVFQDQRWAGVTVAAGRIDEGRVAVFAKEIGSYLPVLEDASTDAEMATLAGNLLTWLLDGDPTAEAAPVPVLVQTGFDSFDPTWNLAHVPVASIEAEAAAFDPALHPLAIVNPRIESAVEAQILMDYVADGGALLLGHQVWTWDVDVEASEGQLLMAQAGLLWRPWYGTGGGPVPSVDDLFLANTDHLLTWLEEVEADWANHAALGFDPAEVGTISRYAVDSHEWLPRDQAWILDPIAQRYAALSEPLYPGDLTERPHAMVVVPLLHRILGLYPGQSPGKGVSVFPGEVPANTPTEDRTFVVDFDHDDPDWLDVPVDPRVRIPTALYAIPGADVSFTVTPDPALGLADGLGLKVVIGAHSDDLAANPVLDRPPIVAFTEAIEVGQTSLNNSYGGLIYLEVDRATFRPGTAEVRIQGAVAAPSFELGVDDPSDWPQILADSAAPWGDIVAPRMISTLPRFQLDQVTDPVSLARGWEDIVGLQYDLMGLDGGAAVPHTLPDGTWHVVEDRQISAGWMHSGYPIMAYEAADLHLFDEVQSWGPYHELGHNLQQSAWKMADSGEVSNNLFSLYCAEQLGQGSRLADQGTWAAADARLAAGDAYLDLDVWEKLTFYRRLSLAYGWDVYRDLFSVTRQRNADLGAALDPGQSPEDYLYLRACELTGDDLTGFFDHYGVGISPSARDAVAAMNLPAPTVAPQTLSD